MVLISSIKEEEWKKWFLKLDSSFKERVLGEECLGVAGKYFNEVFLKGRGSV